MFGVFYFYNLYILITNLFWYQRKEEGEFPFGIEDLLYYVKRVEEKCYDLDFGELKQYFPINLVLSGIFKIVQDIFGNFMPDNLLAFSYLIALTIKYSVNVFITYFLCSTMYADLSYYFPCRIKVWWNCRCWGLALWCSCFLSPWFRFWWTVGLLLSWFVLEVHIFLFFVIWCLSTLSTVSFACGSWKNEFEFFTITGKVNMVILVWWLCKQVHQQSAGHIRLFFN